MSGILMSEISRSTGSRSSSVDRGAAVLGEQHFVALAPQHDRQQLPHRPLIVDDEDARRPALGGRRRRVALAVLMCVTAARAGRRTDTRRARARLRADLNLAVVVGDDAVDDREAEAAALGEACRGTAGTGRRAPRAECRCPRPARSARRRRDAGSTRADEAQAAAVRHRAQAVGREVPDDLLDLPFVGLVPELGSAGTSTSIACASSTSALLRSSSAVSFSARRTSNRAICEALRPRVGEKRSDRRVQPLRLAQHDVHQLLLLGAERQLLPQDLDRARHRRQRIADLVRDAGRHLADRRQPLLDARRRARAS